MIRLFLEGHEVELNESVQFAITKQFEDITSPADIKNDFSKTVKIPFSQKNNKIFGMLFSVDRLTPVSSGQLTGIYFNPYKKIDFRLQWGNTVLMQGYVKMIDVVKSANGKGHYNITLNGELGKVFQEMKKITFDRTTEETKYLIDGSKYVEETINKDLIYRLWTNEPDLSDLSLKDKYIGEVDSNTGEITLTPNLAYKTEDYIGFAPNNSYDENFDYKTFQKANENSSIKFSEVLDNQAANKEEGKTYVDFTGIEADTAIGNGLLPRDIGEYRSYMQLPYIYFNKLFQIFVEKSKEVTGYDVEMDSKWFSNKNPYWNRSTLLLKQLNTNSDGKNYATSFPNTSLGYFVCNTNNPNRTYIPSLRSPINWQPVSGFLDNVRVDFRAGKFDNITFNTPIICKLILADTFYTPGELATRNYVLLSGGFFVNVAFRLKDANGNVVYTSIPYCLHDNNTTNFEGVGVEVKGIPKVSNGRYEFTFNIDLGMTIDRNVVGNDFTIETAVYTTDLYGRTDQTLFADCDSTSGGDVQRVFPDVLTIQTSEVSVTVNCGNNKRSNSKFILNDLWNNEYNLFDTILNYCKQFRIGVFCDDVARKIIFKPLSTYFTDYKVLDWTDKLDLNKEYQIQPITFENKYLLFNYEKFDTELNKLYTEKYGKNFGEYKLSTDYEFNTDEKKLFKDSRIAIPSTNTCLSWNNLYDMNIIYTLPAEINVSNKNDSKKNVSVFGSMLFYKGISNFDTTSNLRSVMVSDDTTLQTFHQTYFYTQDGQEGTKIKVPSYPVLDIVNDKNLCTFTTPAENYTYLPNIYDNTKGLYNNFWENYLNERYNKQNKIVTCYLKLTPFDVANFQYNHFVKIENQLYFVNKIYDYQIDENIPTKVDLITIQDINGYTDTNFVAEILLFLQDRNHTQWEEGWSYVVVNEDPIYVTSTTRFKIEMSENLDVPDFELYIGSDLYQNGDYCDYADDLSVSFWYDPGSLPNEREEGWVKFTNEFGTTITIPVIIAL